MLSLILNCKEMVKYGNTGIMIQENTDSMIKESETMDTTRARILLVDDEDAIIFAFKRILTKSHIKVDTAQTLEEATSLLRNNVYQAAIVDLRLTNVTLTEGFEVIKEVKKYQNGCKIIVVTAYGENNTRDKVYELGANCFMEKPASPHEIKAVLKSMDVLKE